MVNRKSLKFVLPLAKKNKQENIVQGLHIFIRGLKILLFKSRGMQAFCHLLKKVKHSLQKILERKNKWRTVFFTQSSLKEKKKSLRWKIGIAWKIFFILNVSSGKYIANILKCDNIAYFFLKFWETSNYKILLYVLCKRFFTYCYLFVK